MANSLSCSLGCPGSRITLNKTKKYLTNLIIPVKREIIVSQVSLDVNKVAVFLDF